MPIAAESVRMGIRPRWLTQGKLIVLAGVLVDLVAAAALLLYLDQSRAQARSAAVVTTQNTARLLDEGLSAAFDRIELALLAVLDAVDRQPPERNDGAALDALLAHGGRIDTTPHRAPNARPSSLDYALRSSDPAMIDRVAAAWGNDLSSACLLWRETLPDLITRPDDALWNSWLQRRLGQPADPAACGAAPLAERVVLGAIERDDTAVVGWYAQRFEARLQTLMGIATKAGQLTPEHASTWIALARQAGRDDLVTVLRHLGVAEPRVAPAGKAGAKTKANAKTVAKAAAADQALKKSLVGHYYLTNVREVGSELLLKADGNFEYGLAYGAADEQAQGQWTVRDGRVLFTSVRAPAPAGWQPFALQPVVATGAAANGGAAPAAGKAQAATVRVQYRGRPIGQISVTLLGCAAPQIGLGTTDPDGRWVSKLNVPICQIVLQHPQADRGHAFVHAVIFYSNTCHPNIWPVSISMWRWPSTMVRWSSNAMAARCAMNANDFLNTCTAFHG